MIRFTFNPRWFFAFDRETSLGQNEWSLHIGPFSWYKEMKPMEKWRRRTGFYPISPSEK